MRRNAAAHGSKPRASPRPRRGRSSITSANAVTRTHRSAAECSCLGLSPGCGLCPYRRFNKDPPLRGLHCGSREAPAPSRRQCKITPMRKFKLLPDWIRIQYGSLKRYIGSPHQRGRTYILPLLYQLKTYFSDFTLYIHPLLSRA